MIKSAILSILSIHSILVLSSALPPSVQNNTLQATDENRALGNVPGPMPPMMDKTKVELYKNGYYRNYVGTYEIAPNKCYSSNQIGAIKVLDLPKGDGVFTTCTNVDCTGRCFTVSKVDHVKLNAIYPGISNSFAKSYAWIPSYANF
ncbi:hypothetical protein AX774_g561 [Zancudomyces culisetae]|uniref:Uncharacterized protein n=1 Tax=Zancudomyces culisetae TaxID=1213189 RepID=A0A1R1PCM1_ZANCU|nr:hypothetical protein AX774_g7911 [Zancudomyces culisetae]OMH85885.1 hypothetical protein AX774_g561 [Zancudomyces culisetae]|eukprot:OMH78691.1 hypothetical protein AX774_g7911 [Zancudomyces culisetae]